MTGRITKPTCEWCGLEADFLCDFPSGRMDRIVAGRLGPESPDDSTCSRPFCHAHRHAIFSGMACGRGKGGCQPFSIDYCPVHAEARMPS